MSIPHIEATQKEIADSVLLLEDPLRAKYVVEKFLSNVVSLLLASRIKGYATTTLKVARHRYQTDIAQWALSHIIFLQCL